MDPGPSPQNFFQARYAISHAFTGLIRCAHPKRGVWGAPPNGMFPPTFAAHQLAFAPRGRLALASVVTRDIPEIGLEKAGPPPHPSGGKTAAPPIRKLQDAGLVALLGVLALGTLLALRRRR